MEALFMVFKALIVLASKVDVVLSDALQVCYDRMLEWHKGDQEELNYLRDVNHELHEQINEQARRINELEGEVSGLRSMPVDHLSRLADGVFWFVTIPYTWVKEHKIQAFKMLRMVTTMGIKEAKDCVEAAIDSDGQLFPERLSTERMLELVGELRRNNIVPGVDMENPLITSGYQQAQN